MMIKSLDLNSDGNIEYSEFLAGCGSFDKANMYVASELVFNIIDKDNSNGVDFEEFKKFFVNQNIQFEAEEEDDDWTARLKVDQLQVGQELRGIVNSVAPFGCFVDVGADRDGLVHISKISAGFVDKIESLVEPGQEVTVWVTEVSADGKLALSMVQGRGDEKKVRDYAAEIGPFTSVSKELWLPGTVQQITDIGIYVSVEPPGGGVKAQGMVHISQIKVGYVEHPAEEAKIGQEVQVRVTDANIETGRLRLSMKPYVPGGDSQGRPSAELLKTFMQYKPSEWLTGKVHHLTKYGAFVEISSPGGEGMVQGMVHVTEMRDGFVDDPANEVAVDEQVRVRVMKVDPIAGRLVLSMKPEEVFEKGP